MLYSRYMEQDLDNEHSLRESGETPIAVGDSPLKRVLALYARTQLAGDVRRLRSSHSETSGEKELSGSESICSLEAQKNFLGNFESSKSI